MPMLGPEELASSQGCPCSAADAPEPSRLGFRALGVKAFRVQGIGFRIEGLGLIGYRVSGIGLRV